MAYSPFKKRTPIRTNTCKAPRCYLPVWAHGYCRKHQYFYAAKQPIPKYKKKKVNPNSFGYSSQLEMMMDVVYKAPRPIICPISKRDITHFFKGEPGDWVSCAAHILPKGRFSLFKLNPANIMLVHHDVHRLIDQGTEAQRQATGWDFSPFYERQDQLKLEYESYRTGRAGQESPDDSSDINPQDEGTEETGEA